MKAVILAGGKGTRLAPYTSVLPKPLMPVGDVPILEIVLKQLKEHGVNEVIITVGYLASLIQAYFGDGDRMGLKIRYSFEEKALGTAGPLGLIQDLNEAFWLMNGDILTTLNYSEMKTFHEKHGGIATIGLAKKEVHVSLGVIKSDSQGLLTEYIEKPTLNYDVSMGIYMFSPKVLEYIPRNERLDLPDLIKNLVSHGERVFGYQSKSAWFDIGRPEDLELATQSFEKEKRKYLS